MELQIRNRVWTQLSRCLEKLSREMSYIMLNVHESNNYWVFVEILTYEVHIFYLKIITRAHGFHQNLVPNYLLFIWLSAIPW